MRLAVFYPPTLKALEFWRLWSHALLHSDLGWGASVPVLSLFMHVSCVYEAFGGESAPYPQHFGPGRCGARRGRMKDIAEGQVQVAVGFKAGSAWLPKMGGVGETYGPENG